MGHSSCASPVRSAECASDKIPCGRTGQSIALDSTRRRYGGDPVRYFDDLNTVVSLDSGGSHRAASGLLTDGGSAAGVYRGGPSEDRWG